MAMLLALLPLLSTEMRVSELALTVIVENLPIESAGDGNPCRENATEKIRMKTDLYE
jgi:hypothetical protein